PVVDRVGVEGITQHGGPSPPVQPHLVRAGDRAPAIERFLRADADEAGGALTLRVPLAEGRRKLLELHAAPEERERCLVRDRPLGTPPNPVLLATRLPAHPVRLELRDRVAEVERQRYPVRLDMVAVEIV